MPADGVDAVRRCLGMTCVAALLLAAAAAASQVRAGRSSAPAGTLWHHDKRLVGQEGSAVSHISTGAYRALSSYRFVVPSRDGSRYFEEHYESSSDSTEIRLRRTADNGLIERFVVDGALTDIEFSPTHNGLIRVNWGENALKYTSFPILDLSGKRVLWRTTTGTARAALRGCPMADCSAFPAVA